MSDDFRRGILEVLLMVNRNINEGREEVRELRTQIKQLQQVAVQTAEDVSTIRSRLIEQASRHGQEIHEHEKYLIQQDARLTKLERKIEADFEPNIVQDAE